MCTCDLGLHCAGVCVWMMACFLCVCVRLYVSTCLRVCVCVCMCVMFITSTYIKHLTF